MNTNTYAQCALAAVCAVVAVSIVGSVGGKPPGPEPDTTFWIACAGRAVPINGDITVSPKGDQWEYRELFGRQVTYLTWNRSALPSKVVVGWLDPAKGQQRVESVGDMDDVALGAGKREVWFYTSDNGKDVLLSHNTITVIPPSPGAR